MELIQQHSQFNMGGRDVKKRLKMSRACENRIMCKYRARTETIQKTAYRGTYGRLHLTWAFNDK